MWRFNIFDLIKFRVVFHYFKDKTNKRYELQKESKSRIWGWTPQQRSFYGVAFNKFRHFNLD